MTILDAALKAGFSAARTIAGVSISYVRGATTLTVSHAVQGETIKGVIDVGGSEQVVELCDWLISVDALAALNDTPAPGDVITRTIAGKSYVWTVEHRELGSTHWDWSDPARTQYRIRTRKDGAAAYEVSQPTGFDLAGVEVTAS